MRLGMVGLGKMGGNMTVRLLRDGHEVVGYARDPATVEKYAGQGAVGASSLDDLVNKLSAPKIVWVMVPSGDPTEETVMRLKDLLGEGDIVIDGGNSRYTDSIRRAESLNERRIAFLDAGTSGGIWGLDNGYCLMVGGESRAFGSVEPIFKSLAAPEGYAHVGPPGAGHFTKMVHNGIEYALMQAYGEGFELLQQSDLDLDVGQIAELWRHGTVVRSWLLDLAARALANDPKLDDIAPYVEDSGEGRWTLSYAIDNAVPAPAIANALFARFSSRQDASFSAKVIAALRREFGGHAVKRSDG